MPLSALSESYEYLVIGLANPFALRWVPPNAQWVPEGSLVSVDVGEVSMLGRTTPLPNNSVAIHPGDGGRTTDDIERWHHISIGVDGETIYPTGATPDNVDRIAQSSGNRSTILKVLITLIMGNSRTRSFACDVGAGIEIDVKCRAVVSVIPLVPDPTPEISIPLALPEAFVSFPSDFAVAVTTTVTCGVAPQGYRMPLTYSQLFYLGGASPLEAIMPIVSAAREVQIFDSDADDAGGVAVGDFVYALEGNIQPSLVLPAGYAPVGQVTSAPGTSQTDRVMIPGNANAIIASSTTATANALNVVQILNV